jgi:hypothetical protein
MPRHRSTYIGIALYTLNGFPTQWVIVLSSCQLFDSNVWCGTVIDSVNGWVQSWTKLECSPAAFAPHLFLSGVIMVQKANRLPTDIKQSIISNLAWRAQEPRRDGTDYPPSDEYVRQVLLHLCKEKTISLPPRVKIHFAEHVRERLSKLQERPISKIDQYPIIPIVEGDVVIGRTKV